MNLKDLHINAEPINDINETRVHSRDPLRWIPKLLNLIIANEKIIIRNCGITLKKYAPIKRIINFVIFIKNTKRP